MVNKISISMDTQISADDDKVLSEGIINFNEKYIGKKSERYSVYARNGQT